MADTDTGKFQTGDDATKEAGRKSGETSNN